MTPTSRLESFYAFALRLYPEGFRRQYAPAMHQAFRDALGDSSLSRRTFLPLVLRDLITSLAKEHFAMMRNAFARPSLIFNAVVLTGLATVLAQALYTIPQQVLRLGANDPQIALAGDLVDRLEQGIAPAQAVPVGSIDIDRSLTPFVIAYDDQGHPLASQAQLDGAIPVPPSGVFDYVRQHGEERVSWQPRFGSTSNRDSKSPLTGGTAPQPTRSVRIAAVVQRVQAANGALSGFVLAGRNMREVEAREHQVGQLAALAWIGMMGIILCGTAVFGWYTRPRTA